MKRKALLIRGKDDGSGMSGHWAKADLSACDLFLRFPLGGCWQDDEIEVYDCANPEHYKALLHDLDNLGKVDYAFIIFLGRVCCKTTKWGTEYECLHLTDGVDWDARKLELCPRVTVVMDCCRNVGAKSCESFSGVNVPRDSRLPHDAVRERFDHFVMESEEGLIIIHAEEEPQLQIESDTFTHAMIRSAVSWKNGLKEDESHLCVRDVTLRAKKYLEQKGGSRRKLRYDTRNEVRLRHFPFAISC